VRLRINLRKYYKIEMRGNEVIRGNVELIATSQIYKMSVGIYFVSEGQVTQTLIVIEVKL
jgi:hypothetical protein